jgi:hypothetical protein
MFNLPPPRHISTLPDSDWEPTSRKVGLVCHERHFALQGKAASLGVEPP